MTVLDRRVIRFARSLLILVHVALGLFGLAGLLELAFATPPWPPLSNPLFPTWLTVLQWSSMLVAGVVFVAGVAARAAWLPKGMAGVYAAMAAICCVETFGFMVHDARFLQLAAELAAYALILVFLFRTATTDAAPGTPAAPTRGET